MGKVVTFTSQNNTAMTKIFSIGLLSLFSFSATAQWSANTGLNTSLSTLKSADQNLAGTADGKTWIAYYHENTGNYDMRIQLLDAQGNRLLGADGALVNSNISGSAIFTTSLAVDNAGNAIIGMQDERNGSRRIVLYKINQAGASVWGAAGIVLEAGLGSSVAALSNDEVVAAWVSDVNTVRFQKIRNDGTVAWTNPREIPGTNNTTPNVVAGSNGRFSLMFMNRVAAPFYTRVFLQRYTNDGLPLWASAAPVSTLQTTSITPMAIARGKDEELFLASSYFNGSFRDVLLQRVDSSGNILWGNNGVAVTDTANIIEFGHYIQYDAAAQTVWCIIDATNPGQNQSGIIAQQYDLNGNRLWGANGKTLFQVNAVQKKVYGLQLCSDGAVFVNSDATNKIFAGKVDGNGAISWAGLPLELNSTANGKSKIAMSRQAAGQVVIAWAENRGSITQPFAQNATCAGATGPVSALVDLNRVKEGMIVYPNPIAGRALNIKLKLEKAVRVQIYLYGEDGKMMVHESKGILPAGIQVLKLNLPETAGGNYYLVVKAGNKTFSEKLVRVK